MHHRGIGEAVKVKDPHAGKYYHEGHEAHKENILINTLIGF